jgi:hypothetical protein
MPSQRESPSALHANAEFYHRNNDGHYFDTFKMKSARGYQLGKLSRNMKLKAILLYIL